MRHKSKMQCLNIEGKHLVRSDAIPVPFSLFAAGALIFLCCNANRKNEWNLDAKFDQQINFLKLKNPKNLLLKSCMQEVASKSKTDLN